MTGPTGLLNFFVLEASEYVDQLDALLNAGGAGGPDAEAFTRAARALRGSATMARLTGISALAAAVERTGRALRERALPWTPALHGALTAAVDDLRVLVRGARAWGPAEEQRAQTRTAELLGFAPPAARVAAPTPISASTGALFVVSGCTDVASALTAATARPGSPELLADALRRLRALRGVAALRDHPPLPEVLDRIERAARVGDGRSAPAGGAELAVLSAGARALRRAAEDVRAGRRVDAGAPELRAFRDAAAALEERRAESERIVPIAALAPEDGQPQAVYAAPAPGTTAADRFRLEAAAAGEHLRRLVGEARQGGAPADGSAADAAPLAAAARALRDLAHSFGHGALARDVERATAGVETRDPLALAAADAVAALFVSQRRSADELTRRVVDLAGGRVVGALVAVGLAPLPPRTGATPPLGGVAARAATPAAIAPTIPAPPTPTPAPQPAGEPEPEPLPTPVPLPEPIPEPLPEPQPDSQAEEDAGTPPPATRPTGRDLHRLLESGIAGISRLQEVGSVAAPTPAAPAAPTPRPTPSDVVPIETLLYRGRAALGRAIELRDEIRREGGPPSREKLDELFDLLDLAAHG